MVSDYRRPYADSSVFLGFIKGEVDAKGNDRGAIGQNFFGHAEEGKYKVFTSTLTLAEVVKLRRGPVTPDDKLEQIAALFDYEFIELIELDRGIGEDARRLCQTQGLKPNDAVHLASATRGGCDILLAWDDRFVACASPPVPVEEPQIKGQLTLAMEAKTDESEA